MIRLDRKCTRDYTGPVTGTLTLAFDARARSRLRARLDDGSDAGVLLEPGSRLEHGDVLEDGAGTRVRIVAADEAVSCARASDPHRFARACYHLGNRHVPLQIGAGWARYQPDHVLDQMLIGLGLEVQAERAPFEPERGAYAAGSSGHAHTHHHDEHEHEHEHPAVDGGGSG